MAGSVYTCVEIFAGVLFLATRDKHGNGYYPSNGMVSLLNVQQSSKIMINNNAVQLVTS